MEYYAITPDWSNESLRTWLGLLTRRKTNLQKEVDMSAFETCKNICQAELKTVLPTRIAAMDWSPDQLKTARTESLHHLLEDATNNSSWHRRRLQHIGIDTVSPEDLSNLPTMSKQDVLKNFDEITTDPKVTKAWCARYLADGNFYTDGTYCILASGGSTGESGIQVYSPNAAMQFAAASFRGACATQLSEGYRQLTRASSSG